MANSESRRLLEQHNAERLLVQGLLQQARDANEKARANSRAVWHMGGSSDALEQFGLQIEELISDLLRLNEQAHRKALEVIQALKS